MSRARKQASEPVAGSGSDDFVGALFGKTLDHIRWTSLLALAIATFLPAVREQYGLYLLLGMAGVAAVVAVIQLSR